MVHYTASLLALASLVATVLGAPAAVDTPTSLIQCQPYRISWTQGEGGPYFLSVIPGGQPSGAPLADLGQFPAGTNAYTWNVNLAAGTSITLKIVDSAGTPNYSQQVTISPGSATCDTAAAGAPAAGASSAASAPAATTTASRTGRAASVTSAVAGAASSVASQASSVAGAAQSGASSAAASARPTSGASSVVVGSGLGLVVLAAGLVM